MRFKRPHLTLARCLPSSPAGVDAVVVPEGGCGAPDAASPGRSGLHCTPIFRMPGQTNRVVLLYDPLSGSGGDSAAAAGAGAGAAGAAGGSGDGVRADFTFSLEIFEAGARGDGSLALSPLSAVLRPALSNQQYLPSRAGHVTSLHSHPTGYETFFLLSGSGVAHCDGVTFPVRQPTRGEGEHPACSAESAGWHAAKLQLLLSA